MPFLGAACLMKKDYSNYRLLIIEDESSWVQNISLQLRKTFPGIVFETSHTAGNALKKLDAFKPDIFLVDIMLPDMNGLQLTRLIRQMPKFAHSPLILVTILASDEQLLYESLKAGADAYIEKLFSQEDLAQTVERSLKIVDALRILSQTQQELNELKSSLGHLTKGLSDRVGLVFSEAERNKRYAQLFENAPDAIVITSADGTILEVNNMLCHFTGLAPHQLLGKGFATLFTEQELQRVPLEKERVLSGEIVENERYIIGSNGQQLATWMKSMLLPDGTVVSFIRDVTHNKITENALRAEKSFSQTIAEKLPVIIYIHDLLKQQNVFTNRNIAAYLGYPPDVLTDDHKNFLDLVVHPDDQKMFNDFYKSADLTDTNLAFHFEYRMKTFAGEWRWFKGYERAWDYKDGKVNMLIGAVLDITSEKEKEEALKESEQRYKSMMKLFRTLTDNMPDMLWAKDVQKRFLFVNKAICENLLHAIDTDEPIGKTDLFFANRIRAERPDDKSYHTFGEICQDSDSIVLNTRMPGQFDEFGNVRGKFLYLDVIKAPIFDEYGQLIGTVGAGRDITQRKRQEKYIEIQHAVAEAVVESESLHDLIALVERKLSEAIDTSNFYVALVNEATGKLYTPFLKDEVDDLDEWEQEGSATGLVISSAQRLWLFSEDLNALIASGKIKAIGQTAQVWIGIPLFSNNTVIGALVVQSYSNPNAFDEQDVELLEFMANQLGVYIQRTKALEQTRMLGMAIEQSQSGVLITDPKYRVIYVNNRFTEITGYHTQNLPKLNDDVLQSIVDDPDKAAAIFRAISDMANWNDEILIVKSDGQKVWVSLSVSALKNQHGTVSNWLYIVQDISEKHKMLDELIRSRDRAEESDKLKTAFLMNMSHEIRTPLNSIMGFADLMMGDDSKDPETRTQAGMIYKNGQRLLELMNNILKLSKIDAGSEVLTPVSFNPAQLIQEVERNFIPQALRKGLVLQANIPAGNTQVLVYADRIKIHQVLDNLINNAIKFTDKGQIEFGYVLVNNKIEFFVRDTGRGIAANEIERIFERFYQADISLSRGYEGAGLGLALCKSMVNLMGGRIWAESTYGKGTTFYFEIPVEIKESQNIISKPQDQPGNINTQANKDWKLLIVDDDETSLVMMKAVMKIIGFEASFASNGVAALEILRRDPAIKLVLLDVKMPVMDGMQVVEKIKQSGFLCKVVATTAYAMPGDEARMLQAGFDDYLAKPVTKAQLIKIIEKYLNLRY